MLKIERRDGPKSEKEQASPEPTWELMGLQFAVMDASGGLISDLPLRAQVRN